LISRNRAERKSAESGCCTHRRGQSGQTKGPVWMRSLPPCKRRVRCRSETLSKELNVSPVTIRRDLDSLENQGMLRRTHGGAVSIEPLFYEPFRNDRSFQAQVERFADEKRRIGRAAAALIEDGEIYRAYSWNYYYRSNSWLALESQNHSSNEHGQRGHGTFEAPRI